MGNQAYKMKKIIVVFLLFNCTYIFSQKLKLPKGWNLISLKGKPAYINLITGKVTREFPKKVKKKLSVIIEEEEENDDDIFDPTITYKVKKGETIVTIAKKFDLTIDNLYQLNNLKTIKELGAGKNIIIGYAHNMEEKNAFLKGDISILKHEH